MNVKQLKIYTINNQPDIPEHWITGWLLHVLEKEYSFLITDSDYELSKDELNMFDKGVVKMQKGTPLAYLTGIQDFWSLSFMVNEHTLIPRADTEILVETTLKSINDCLDKYSERHVNLSKKLLDLGTGSGCIAVSLASELPLWQVTAVDLSVEALKVAKINAENNNIKNISFVQSSWFENIRYENISNNIFKLANLFNRGLSIENNHKFSVIVSNPPYIDKTDKHLDKLTAEPITALVADNKGLRDIEEIVKKAPGFLETGGLLLIEHGHDQGDAIKYIFKLNGFTDIEVVKDYGGNDRLTKGIFIDNTKV